VALRKGEKLASTAVVVERRGEMPQKISEERVLTDLDNIVCGGWR
jgi:hypothetical protein